MGVVGMEKKHWAGMARDACVCIFWFQSLCDSHFARSLLIKRATQRTYMLKGEPKEPIAPGFSAVKKSYSEIRRFGLPTTIVLSASYQQSESVRDSANGRSFSPSALRSRSAKRKTN